MFDFLVNLGNWVVETFQPLLLFFRSVITGLKTLVDAFPILLRLSNYSVAYLPSIFAAFVAITVSVLIVFQLIGRNSGG